MSRKKAKVLVIDRRKWRRGGDGVMCMLNDKFGGTALLNDRGKMCCLGFDAKACGVPRSIILKEGMPDDVVRHLPYLTGKQEEIVNAYRKGRVTKGSCSGVPSTTACRSGSPQGSISSSGSRG